LLAPAAADMSALDAVIRERLGSDVALIRTIADYIIGAGGKRLRPAILSLSSFTPQLSCTTMWLTSPIFVVDGLPPTPRSAMQPASWSGTSCIHARSR
jgi:hypothetical protein